MAVSKSIKTFFLVLVFSVLISQEVDARRQILKGRKTLNRTYYRDSAIPAWAIVLLVGLGEIIVGGIIFVVMKKVILDPPITGSYSPANTEEV